MASGRSSGKDNAGRQVPPKRKPGRPPGPDADRPRRAASTLLLTEMILEGAQRQLGREPTAPEIETKLGIGRPTDATGRPSGSTWKNMRRGASTLNDERFHQLCKVAIRCGWLTAKHLEEFRYPLSSAAALEQGSKIADWIAPRRVELTEFQAARLAAVRALKRFMEVERGLKRSELVDPSLYELSHDVHAAGLDPRFFIFDAEEALDRIGRLELQFLSPPPHRPRLRKPKAVVPLPPVNTVNEIDAASESMLKRR